MPRLVEYQRRFAAQLLAPPGAEVELWTNPAIEIHRRTVLSGLKNALALSFPTVRKLTGPDYFDTLAGEFARQHPPQSAVLYDYGAELPAFLETFAGAENHPYVHDVARFDWLVDQIAHCSREGFRIVLGVPGFGKQLRLPISLRCARFEYGVDLIRDALESEYDAELQKMNVQPNPRRLVLWRSSGGTSVKALSDSAWRILEELHTGCDAQTALERASESYDANEVLSALRDEIFASSFARLN